MSHTVPEPNIPSNGAENPWLETYDIIDLV